MLKLPWSLKLVGCGRIAGKPEAINQTGNLCTGLLEIDPEMQPGGRTTIRMVAGYLETDEGKHILVAEARYVPNTQFLSIPFRSELIHWVA
jgi:hypothetical protein